MHESHSFAPRPTTYPDFVQPGGFPRLQRGAGTIEAVRGTSVPLAGAIAAAEAAGATLVPLGWCFANPAGPITDDAFERISRDADRRTRQGAGCGAARRRLSRPARRGGGRELSRHAEGELLRRVRAMIGATPLTISLDPHANLTAQIVALSDAVVPFRTYPHIDMKEAGAQAMRLLLARIDRGEPWARAFRQLDFWLPLGSQCTMLQPMDGVMQERAAMARRNSVAELGFCFGFPFADFADCGAAICGLRRHAGGGGCDGGCVRRTCRGPGGGVRAGHAAGGRGGGGSETDRRRRAPPGGAGRHPGQSWRRRPR